MWLKFVKVWNSACWNRPSFAPIFYAFETSFTHISDFCDAQKSCEVLEKKKVQDFNVLFKSK